MEIDIAQERFVAHGLMILARNYLDVYPYDRWSDKVTNHGSNQRSESVSYLCASDCHQMACSLS